MPRTETGSNNRRFEVILNEDGFVHRSIVETPMGTQDSLLAQLADNGGVATPYMGKSPKGNPFSMCLTRNSGVMMVTEFTQLPVFAPYERVDMHWYEPIFGNATPALGQIWNKTPVPNSHYHGRLFFGLEYLFDGPDNTGRLSPQKAYLILKMDEEDEARFINYPNQYTDGSVCMGRDWSNNREGGKDWFVDMFDYAVDVFMNTRANSDLRTEHTERLLRQDPNGQWFNYTALNIRSYCPIISARYANLILTAAKSLPTPTHA